MASSSPFESTHAECSDSFATTQCPKQGGDTGKIVDAVKAGAKAAADSLKPGEYTVAGRDVRCLHCGATSFEIRWAPATEVASSMFHGYALRCAQCTFVMLFASEPKRR